MIECIILAPYELSITIYSMVQSTKKLKSNMTLGLCLC